MTRLTELDRLNAVVRASAAAINNALCILLSEESSEREYEAAVSRIAAQAEGLLRITAARRTQRG